ncbi:GPW/gp25 family protein [Vibrio olivae]|uniref:GPW/gp25 family protein n=1 Tax=Vibrio olivae TaxID=1243002 RepID=A0ABV5HR34_9VIBR
MIGMDMNTGKRLSGVEHLKQSIRKLLSTPLGSRVMRRNYGSKLFELIDNPTNPETVADIISATAEALNTWEPRIRVNRVEVRSASKGKVTLAITGIYLPNGESITMEGIQIE